jgi:hypothetical protein
MVLEPRPVTNMSTKLVAWMTLSARSVAYRARLVGRRRNAFPIHNGGNRHCVDR